MFYIHAYWFDLVTLLLQIITLLQRKEKLPKYPMQLNFPEYSFRLRKRDEKHEIFDEVRKKWLVCTPEEWVRQHFIKWLILERNYPASSIAIEGGLKLNRLSKRTDIVVFKDNNPLLLVECKAPTIALSQSVFDQLFRYNLKINAPLLAVTNGIKHVFAVIQDEQPRFIQELPSFPAL